MPRLSTLISLDAQAALAAAAAPNAANPFATIADVGSGGTGGGLVPIAGLIGQPLPNTFAASDGSETIVLPATAVHNDRAGVYCLTTTQVAPPTDQVLYFGDPDTGSVVGPDTITLQAGAYAEWVCCDFGEGETGWLPAGASNEGGAGGSGGGLAYGGFSSTPTPGTWIYLDELHADLPSGAAVGSRFGIFVDPDSDGALLHSYEFQPGVRIGNAVYEQGLPATLRGGAYLEFELIDLGEGSIWNPVNMSAAFPAPLEKNYTGAGPVQPKPNEWARSSEHGNVIHTPSPAQDGDVLAVWVDSEGCSIIPATGQLIESPDSTETFDGSGPEGPEELNVPGANWYEWVYTVDDSTWHPRQNVLILRANAIYDAIQNDDSTSIFNVGNKSIAGLLEPADPTDAATKSYVDTAVAGGPGPGGDRTASGIRTATTVVATSTAAAPTVGQVLTATGPSAATWQSPAGGGVTFGNVSGMTPGNANSNGVASTVSHSDHVHSLPSFGTAANTFAAGNDSRIVNAVPNTRTITGTGLTGGGDLTANRTLAVTYGTAANTALQGNQAAGGDTSGTLNNLTVTQARGLKSATTTVSVSAATAPIAGQVLTAQNSTTASWVTPAPAASPPITTITASTTAVAGTRYLVDSTSGVITVTLPTAASSTGKDIVVKRIAGSNSVVIDGNASETIDGALTLTLSLSFEWALLTSNGTAWFQLS